MNGIHKTGRLFFFLIFTVLLCCRPITIKAHTDDELLIGTAPYYNTGKLRRGFAPLMKYLSDRLGRKITFTVTATYEELAEKVENGTIDIGFFGPGHYVQLKQRYPELHYLVTAQSSNGARKTAYYYSWLIAHKDSEIIKVKHLKGKSFAFTNKHSSSGYIYLQGYFRKRHISPDDFFAQVIFAGTHENVTDMIARHEIESGVSHDVNLRDAEEKYGRIFRRIKRIGPILNPSFAARHQLDHSLYEKIIFALENLPLNVLNKDLAYTGFQRLSETNFAPLVDLLTPDE